MSQYARTMIRAAEVILACFPIDTEWRWSDALRIAEALHRAGLLKPLPDADRESNDQGEIA